MLARHQFSLPPYTAISKAWPTHPYTKNNSRRGGGGLTYRGKENWEIWFVHFQLFHSASQAVVEHTSRQYCQLKSSRCYLDLGRKENCRGLLNLFGAPVDNRAVFRVTPTNALCRWESLVASGFWFQLILHCGYGAVYFASDSPLVEKSSWHDHAEHYGLPRYHLWYRPAFTSTAGTRNNFFREPGTNTVHKLKKVLTAMLCSPVHSYQSMFPHRPCLRPSNRSRQGPWDKMPHNTRPRPSKSSSVRGAMSWLHGIVSGEGMDSMQKVVNWELCNVRRVSIEGWTRETENDEVVRHERNVQQGKNTR